MAFPLKYTQGSTLEGEAKIYLGIYGQQGSAGSIGTLGQVEMVFSSFCADGNHCRPEWAGEGLALAHPEAIPWCPGTHPHGSYLGLLFIKENSRRESPSWEPSSSWWAVAYRMMWLQFPQEGAPEAPSPPKRQGGSTLLGAGLLLTRQAGFWIYDETRQGMAERAQAEWPMHHREAWLLLGAPCELAVAREEL